MFPYIINVNANINVNDIREHFVGPVFYHLRNTCLAYVTIQDLQLEFYVEKVKNYCFKSCTEHYI